MLLKRRRRGRVLMGYQEEEVVEEACLGTRAKDTKKSGLGSRVGERPRVTLDVREGADEGGEGVMVEGNEGGRRP